MVADGAGLSQITAAMYNNNNKFNLESFNVIGLQKTHSANSLITDSAASGTAMACGIKTENGTIGIDTKNKSFESILEICEKKGYNSGIIVTSSIVHATPASFYAKVVSRAKYQEIAYQLSKSEVDFYYINLINYIGKKKIIHGWMACLAPDGKFCLFRKGKKSWVSGSVHPEYNLNGTKGNPFKNSINHYMSKNLSDLLIKFNRNTTLYAGDLKSKKKNVEKLFSIRKIFSRFFKSFIFRGGYKSGGVGFFIGILCAIYPYISAVKSKEN